MSFTVETGSALDRGGKQSHCWGNCIAYGIPPFAASLEIFSEGSHRGCSAVGKNQGFREKMRCRLACICCLEESLMWPAWLQG